MGDLDSLAGRRLAISGEAGPTGPRGDNLDQAGVKQEWARS